MRGPEIVAAVLEGGENGESLRLSTGRHWNRAGAIGQDLEWFSTGEDECDFVRDSVHFVPRLAVVLRFGVARVLLGWCLGVTKMNDCLRPVEVDFIGRKIDEAFGIA